MIRDTSEPHLGHLYTATLADANFRWNRWKNGRDPYATGSAIEKDDVFVVGTDEHGMKIQRAAERSKKTPMEHCDHYSGLFRKLFDTFDISYTHFVRTSQAEHHKAVIDFWVCFYWMEVHSILALLIHIYNMLLFRNASKLMDISIKALMRAGTLYVTNAFTQRKKLKISRMRMEIKSRWLSPIRNIELHLFSVQ